MTKNIHVEYDTLSLGELLKRSEIEYKLNIPSVWPTGIREFSNCVFFFVTLDKTDKIEIHKYNDFFEERIFYWESQKRQSEFDPLLQKIKNEQISPILFIRILGNDKFTFLGKLKYVSHDKNTSNPVQFSFLINDFTTLNLLPQYRNNIEKILSFKTGQSTTSYHFKKNSRLQKIVLASDIIKKYSEGLSSEEILIHSQELIDTIK